MAVLGQPSRREAAQADRHHRGFGTATLVVLAVFTTFFLVAAVRAPVPGVGEPHYLAKAKHFWQPDWCARDLFLQSSNPHLAFYVALGWLTKWCSFETTAWIGRAASQLLLALGWTALVSRLTVGKWTPLWTAWGFLGLFSLGTLAGEWVVGGVEGKVFSYAFLFLALAAAVDRRPIASAALAGAAVSFHSIVGIWGIAALVLTILVSLWRSRFAAWSHTPTDPSATGDDTPPPAGAVTWAVAFLVFVACSLPGLLPSLQVVMDKTTADSFAANYIQVFYRLAHHLYPATFAPSAAVGYLAMLAAWWWISRRAGHAAEGSPQNSRAARQNRYITAYVVAVCLIALGGAAIGLGEVPTARSQWQAIRMTLMKFYAFRLFDVVVPFVLVMTLADRTARLMERARGGAAVHAAPWLAWSVPLLFALLDLPEDRNPSRLPPPELADWKVMCEWIDTHLPEDALVCTPYGAWAFKWYAQRAEYVSYKDCPQDAAGIIEWNRRLKYLEAWGSRSFDNGYTVDELRRLRDDTHCSHWLAYRAAPVHATPTFERGRFRLYDLHALESLQASGDR